MICAICSKIYEKDRKKGNKGEICGSCRVAKARRARKAKAVEYKGGKCERCGYCKSNAALTFHHKIPEEKSFGISEKGKARKWSVLQTELDKCVLLCHNCHAEIHEEETTLTKMLEFDNLKK